MEPKSNGCGCACTRCSSPVKLTDVRSHSSNVHLCFSYEDALYLSNVNNASSVGAAASVADAKAAEGGKFCSDYDAERRECASATVFASP